VVEEMWWRVVGVCLKDSEAKREARVLFTTIHEIKKSEEKQGAALPVAGSKRYRLLP